MYPAGTKFAPEMRWEKWALAKHLVERDQVRAARRASTWRCAPSTSGINLGLRAMLQSTPQPDRRAVQRSYERIEEQQQFTVGSGQTVRLDKLVTYRPRRATEARPCPGPLPGRTSEPHAATGFDASLARSREVWEQMWTDCDCAIDGDPEGTRAVRFGIYHLLIAANGARPDRQHRRQVAVRRGL